MKNLTSKLTAVALSSLMAVSTVGAVTASAAEITTPTADRTIYFINNKGWDTVFDYTWGTNAKEVAFPGTEMIEVGTTKVLGDTTYTVYATEVEADCKIIFDEGTEHGQQSNDLDLTKTSANCFCLDENNKIQVVTNFQTDKIDFTTSVATCALTTESNNRNCFKSNGNNTLYINAAELDDISNVKVELTSLNGTTTEVNANVQNNVNGAMRGMYYIQVPQGNYLHADVIVNDTSYGQIDITDTTDSIKISNGEALACQRIFFNNDLSTKTWANQAVCVYAWDSATKEEETSFINSYPMTYYQNVFGTINQYFYDVPLSYDMVIFLTKDCYSSNVTTQTENVALNYTTNTDSTIIMDGYAPVRENGVLKTTLNDDNKEVTVVSLFLEQVKSN